jgi:hypothetical protein
MDAWSALRQGFERVQQAIQPVLPPVRGALLAWYIQFQQGQLRPEVRRADTSDTDEEERAGGGGAEEEAAIAVSTGEEEQ